MILCMNLCRIHDRNFQFSPEIFPKTKLNIKKVENGGKKVIFSTAV